MYWVTEEFKPVVRKLNEPGPYKCLIDDEEYDLVVTYLAEGTLYNKELSRLVDWIWVNGYTIPNHEFVLYEEILVWHEDDPCKRVKLSVSSWVDTSVHAGKVQGEGSLMLLGPLRHYQEEETQDDA